MSMPQPSRDDREPQDVTDIDTARLALRGAVESLRSLQEVNQRLKGEIQEYANRNKLLDQRLVTIQTDLNVSNAKLDRADELYNRKEETLRRNIRQEVALEENQRWQAEMAALRQSIEMWKAAREQKEAELERLNHTLADKESDILTLQKEKVIVQGKANQELAGSLAKARADLKLAIEAVIQEKDKQLDVLKTELNDQIQHLEVRLRAKEQEAQLKDENVAKQFHDRHKELSEFWAKREQEIWDRAKQAKDTMEAGLKERWEKRLEDLTQEFAQKTYLQEQNYANLSAALDQKEQALQNQLQGEEAALRENFVRKTGDLEQSHVERSAALEMQWNAREKDLTNAHRKALDAERVKFNEEVRKSKEEASAWMVARDADFHLKQNELRLRHQALEKELRESWGGREEQLTLRHSEEIKKVQETLSQTLRDKLGGAAEEYGKRIEALQLHLAEVDKKSIDQDAELRGLRDRVALAEKERAQMVATLESREAAARKLLEDKERTWTATHESLRKQSLESAEKAFQETEAHKLRIAELEKQDADARARLNAQHERIQSLDKERTTLSSTLQEREATLHSELDAKEREWAVANEALRAQLTTLTTESVRRSETHRGRISDLEKRCEAQASEFSILQKQHLQLEGERARLAETLKVRETALLMELDVKQKEWKTVNDALQEQLTRLSTETGRSNEAQQARIADLERQSQEAQSQVKISQQKLQALDKERATLTEALQFNETSFRKQLEDREGEWAALNGTLQQQLAALTRETSEKIETLQELASGLEKQKTEISAHARSLENQLQSLQREHGQLSETLRTRESSLLKELEVKRAEWRAVQETLQDQLKKVTGESAQRNEVQLGRIADLETRQLEARSEIKLLQQKIQHFEEERTRLLSDIEIQAQQAIQRQELHQAQVSDLERLNGEARAHLQDLQEKLHNLQKEREAIAETLAARESLLKKQLEEKEQALAANKEAHQRQIDILKRDTFKKDEAQQAQIAHLEKERSDIKAQWMALRERLHHLEQTRQDTADKLDMQEKSFRLDLADKERAWTAARESLQDQLAAQSKAATQESAAQLSRIGELEKRAAEAEAQVIQLKDKLQGLDKDHAALSMTLQDREATLVQHLEDKGREWARKEEALNEKLAVAVRDAAQKQQAQQAAIVTLEERGKQAGMLMQDLKEKLEALGKERDTVAEKLRVRETALSKELTDKEQAWKRTNEDLHDQLLKLKKSSGTEATALHARVGELEKQLAAGDKYIIGLKEKLHSIDNEKASQTQSFQGRERDLQLLMEEKARAWSQSKEALEEKLKILTRESTETYQTQKAMIVDLEAGRKEAAAQIAALQDKLFAVVKDRDATAETLKNRENALQKELTEKENAWTRAEQALQEALASQMKASIKDSAVKDSRIVELEKKSADAETYIQTLRDKLQLLDKERSTLSLALQNRERDLRQQLIDKEHVWTLAQEALQEKLSALELQSTRTQQGQKEAILELETRRNEAAELISSLQLRLNEVEKDRNVTSDMLRVREAALQKEMAQKQTTWEKLQYELQDRLAQLQKSSAYQSATQQERIAELERLNSAANADMAELRAKLQSLDKERTDLVDSFLGRERTLQTQLEEKTHAWDKMKQGFEEKLNVLSRESAQTQQAQRESIAELQNRGKDAAGLISNLQQKLNEIEKDRDVKADTLRLREAALHKELLQQQAKAEKIQNALQEEVSQLRKSSTLDSASQRERIDALQKQNAASDVSLAALREKLQIVDQERAAQAQAFQMRERNLQLEIEEKSRTWAQLKETLEEKLKSLTHESALGQQVQKALAADLEASRKDAAAQIAALQEKLSSLTKDRDATADTLKSRENALRKELTEKEKAWTRAEQALQEALASQTKSSIKDNAQKDSRIADLEKKAGEAETYIQTLRDKLQVLDKERTTLSLSLQNRERDLRQQLEDKEHAWTLAKEALQEKLAALELQSARTQQGQKDAILELEKQRDKAAGFIAALQQKLDEAEKDRDVKSDTLRVREATLHKELLQKQAVWEKIQNELQDELASLRKSSSLESTAQRERIDLLQKQNTASEIAVTGLREKLQILDQEHTAQAQAFQMRERNLLLEIDEKTRTWTHVKDALEEKLKLASRESAQAQQVQKALIADLEMRQKEAAEVIASLQARLDSVEGDRDATAETLHIRESALQKELAQKQTAWEKDQAELQDRLAELQKSASFQNASQQERIAELERQNTLAGADIVDLRTKLQSLDKERSALKEGFLARERGLQAQLEEKTHTWAQIKESLDQKLSALSRESAQVQAAQKESIADLNLRLQEASARVLSLQDQLDGVEHDRDATADTLRVRESALQKELLYKQAAWEKVQNDLQDQLAQLKKSMSVDSAAQHERISELQHQNSEANASITHLREKLQSVDKDRITAIQAAQTREHELLQQIEDKTHAWAQLRESLEDKIKTSAQESHKAQLAQKALLAELDLRHKDSAAHGALLQEKLTAVEKERDVASERLHQRESALQKELSDKQQAWQEIREDLQDQFAQLKKSSSAEIGSQQARLLDLEKQNAAAEKQIALLRDKGQALDKERAMLSTVFRDKESQLRQQLDENTQAWLYAKGTLEEKLTTVSREAAQTQKLQQNRIADLEKFVSSAAAEMEGVREKLQTVQIERDTLAESLRVREKALRSEMTEKEQIWEKTRSELETQLAGTSGEMVRQREEQKVQLAALHKRNAEAAALIQTLQAQLQSVQGERESLSGTLQTRETALREELSRKQREWTQVKQELQEQIETMTQEHARRLAAQQAELKTLEKRSVEAEAQAHQWREKLQGVDKERRSQTEHFDSRQADLREELEDKERAWAASTDALKEQLAALKRDSSKKDQSQQTQLAALERQNAEAKTQVVSLRDQLTRLEQERHDVTRQLESREQAFRLELDEKEHAWRAAQETLEAQWAAFKNDVQQKSMSRENRIFELEKISAAAVAEAQGGREQLQKLEAERAAQLDAVRAREMALRKELAEKEHSWNRLQRDLQDQLAALSSESTQMREEQQARIGDLSRRYSEAEDRVQALQAKIQDLEKERDTQSETLNNREAALLAQLEKKQSERDEFKEQLSDLQSQKVQLDDSRRAQITELQKQTANSEAHAESLRAKLRQIEKEREGLNESLKGRERGYAKELEQKQREWDAAREELQQQLTRLRKESSQKQELQKAQLTDAERAYHEAQTTLQALRERVHLLEKERDALKEDVDQRENNLEKRRAALEKTIRQREQELVDRTTHLEEELRQTWLSKERELSERMQSTFEKEQSAFHEKLTDLQTHSQEQLSKLHTEQQDLQRHKTELEHQKADQAVRFEQRDKALREREDKAREEARRQLTQLESERSTWNERLKQMEAEQTDLQKRQAQVQSRETEIDRLREQLTASLDAPSIPGKSVQGVQSLVEEWVFGFAHQVRNPLGIIRSMTESMMNTRVSGQAQRESFSAILQAVDGLARRLGEFIDFSKPVKVSLRSTVLAQVAEQALNSIQSAATQQNVQIHRRFDDKAPVLLLDPDQLQTALQHLLTNALEAMPQGGNLTFEIRPDSGGVIFRIQDSGSGISAAHMKEIGKPFFTTKTGRIGLGLAGAKRILHSLGGELTFDSRPGQGTSVICRFKAKGK